MEPSSSNNVYNISPAAQVGEENPPGCLGTLGWLAAAFVLPVFSPTFYHRAARARLFTAMAFFFIFALAVSAVQAGMLGYTLFQVGGEIQTAYAEGRFPVIHIQAGEARVDGPQPFILVDNATTLVAVDTSGVYQDIDFDRYSQGLLLTRRSLIYLTNTGEYQKIPLSQLQMALDADPLVLDGENVLSLWTVFGTLVGVLGLFGLLLWNTFIRLTGLIAFGLVLWGLAALARKDTNFAEVLATGIYALVPAVYASSLLSRAGMNFMGQFTVLAGIFWVLALLAALYPYHPVTSPSTPSEYLRSVRPLRAWRAWIGLPLLVLLAYESIIGPFEWYISWSLAFLTLASLVGTSLLPMLSLEKPLTAHAGGGSA